MMGHDMIVVGASAGGVEALKQLVHLLPADLPAAVGVVLHLPSHATSVLPAILSRNGPLPAVHPEDGQVIKRGHIYVAPPDYHMLIKHNHISLVHGPKENRNRPSIDPLFRSAARTYGNRVVGVILSGTLDDGTAGLISVKMGGGVCVAQDPTEAMYGGMPQHAIDNDHIDYVLPLLDIAALLTRLAREPVSPQPDAVVAAEVETEIDMLEMDNDFQTTPPGIPAMFACPECGGTLWEMQEGDLIRFRCRTGHAFTVHSLLAEQADALENALWVALRALQERAALARDMADRAEKRERFVAAEQFRDQAQSAEESASLIRNVLQRGLINYSSDVLKKDVSEAPKST